MDPDRSRNEAQINLNPDQMFGMNAYGLSLQQVQSPDFGNHTLRGIQGLINANRATDNVTAMNMLAGFDESQVTGIVDLNLSPAQVRTPNFGAHTLNGIMALMARDENTGIQEAFEELEGLTVQQAIGIINLEFTRQQVLNPNFGRHTMDAVQVLVYRELGNGNHNYTMQDALQEVNGLNAVAIRGLINFQLTRDQVTQPSFGQHTLQGIQALMNRQLANGNNNFTMQDAFNEVNGLNVVEITGMIDYGLTRAQVTQGTFGEPVLGAIRTLQAVNPAIAVAELYNFTMQMDEYQVRGLTQLNLAPEQLGIQIENNQLVQLDPYEHNFLSGRAIDATQHLMESEGMQRDEALAVAERLNTAQVVGLLNFGLTAQQVESPDFKEKDNVLAVLIEYLEETQQLNRVEEIDESSDLKFPLDETIQQAVRAVLNSPGLDKFIASKFLIDISKQDVLGVFDGLLQAMNARNNQEESTVQSVDAPDIPRLPDYVPNVP